MLAAKGRVERRAVIKPRPEWMGLAACSRAGPADWFPSKGPRPDDSEGRVPVLPGAAPVPRLRADPDLTGVWGGTTEKERKALRTQFNARAC